MRFYLDIESMPRDPTARFRPPETRAELADAFRRVLEHNAADGALDQVLVDAALAECQLVPRSRRNSAIWVSHQPIVISWAVDDYPVQHVAGLDENQLLAEFRTAMLSGPSRGLGKAYWIGHYVRGFDLRILRIALLRHGLTKLAALVPAARRDKRAICTQALACGADPEGRVSLEDLAQGLGLGGKGELGKIDWHDTWAELEQDPTVLDKVTARCDLDVELMRNVHRTLVGLTPPTQEDTPE